MTTLTTSDTFVVLGESFHFDVLKDIAQHGADIGVHGFTHSSDLHNKYEEYETQIENALDELGYLMHEVFAEKMFVTLQQYKEWACWTFLEFEASRITDYWFSIMFPSQLKHTLNVVGDACDFELTYQELIDFLPVDTLQSFLEHMQQVADIDEFIPST